MPTRRTVIQKITLNSNVSDVIFSGIPQHYSSLKIIASARSTWPGSGLGGFFMEFNGSSGGGAGYKMAYIGRSGTNSSGGSYTTNATYPGSFLRYVPSVGGTASTFSDVEINIPNYTSSNYKTYSSTVIAEQNSASMSSAEVASVWNNTAPITQIKLWVGQPDNTGTEPYSKFVAGSTFYLYGITHVPIINGGEVSIRGGFKYHTFRSTGTLQVVEPGDVECLVVAGGAGGGVAGGGAGGTRLVRTRLQRTAQNYTVTIGSGGAADTSGNNTTIASGGTTYLSATGGGRAAAYENGDPGSSGGSGGGGRANSAAGSGNAGGYTPPEGYSGAGSNSTQSGGGGGGASASGSSGSSSTGGNGGAGLLAFGNHYGGGGGGGGASTGGAGGTGGGGGGAGGSVINGGRSAGLPNTGGGSGGNWTASSTFTGGSGIVIIRYPYDGN